MKTYLVEKASDAYNLIGKGVKNRKFTPTEGVFLAKGRSFNGVLVFIPMTIGFQPMIKVLDPKLVRNVYYAPNDVKVIADDKMSGFTDYNHTSGKVGLDYYGYANPDTAPELDTYKNDYPQYSSLDGDFFTNLFKKKLTPEQQESADNKEELSVGEMEQAHKSSGSKTSFTDWLKSTEAIDLANNMSSLVISLINKDGNGGSKDDVNSKTDDDSSSAPTPKGNKILGMHPITFGITTVGVLVGIGVAILLLRTSAKTK